MKKVQKNVEGNYYSTYAFVSQNNLEKIANEVLGKGWEAEDDVNQIQQKKLQQLIQLLLIQQ